MSFLNNLSVIKVSVIIPTYKPKEYLWECLNSLVKQTFSKDNYEVLIVLNGCCEPWKSDIERYVSKNMSDMQVRFIQTDEAGVSNARNIGLDRAQGKFVTFIDDDDYVSSGYLEELSKISSQNTIGLCYPYAFIDGNATVQIPNRITAQYNEISRRGILPFVQARKFFSGPVMKLIPMDCIRNRRFDVRFKNGEDSLFMFLISDHFQNVAFTDTNICYYRRYRCGSAVTAKQPIRYKLFNTLNLLRAYCSIYFTSVRTYNFIFFITRILGTIKKLFI